MSALKIEDFVPFYPFFESSATTNNSNVYNQDSWTPTEILSLKKEFYQERASNDDIASEWEEQNYLLKHQRMISRFLSENTPYSELLIFHQMGLGKTRTAIGAIEESRLATSPWNIQKNQYISNEILTTKRALILVKGRTIERNFISELIKALPGQYLPENFDELTAIEQIRRIGKRVNPFYDIQTFETFAKTISKLTNEQISATYSNRYIVIDEAHHIRPSSSTKTKVNIYGQFHRFLHAVVGCKKLLMSGTPMKDLPREIATLMNLILPLDQQLPSGSEFDKTFFKNGQLQSSAIPLLKTAFRGRVSYIRMKMSDQVQIEFQGKKGISVNEKVIKHFVLYPSMMSSLQTKIYKEAFRKDSRSPLPTSEIEEEENEEEEDEKEEEKNKIGGIYSNSRQASDFVFPDGTYGTSAFKKNVTVTSRKLITQSSGTRLGYTLTGKIRQQLDSQDSNDKKLDLLKNYSCKYAAIVKEILNAPEENAFVSTEFVQGGGAILFSKILELFGFSRSRGLDGTSARRYAIITGETPTSQITKILKLYNSPENKYGRFIQVIIGSKVISEGVSLMNTRQFHSLDPYWNFGEIEQSIYRVLRSFSYDELLKDNVDVKVKLFLHVAIPNDPKVTSIDILMYYISEWKDLLIKQIERVLRESAFDCYLNYNQNVSASYKDGSRECDYTDCKFRCDDVRPSVVVKENLILDTYSLLYARPQVEWITTRLKRLFHTFFYIHFEDLRSYFPQVPFFLLLQALNQMIISNIVIKNKYNLDCYLREDHNLFFLVRTISNLPRFEDAYYTMNPNVSISSFRDIRQKQLLALIDSICVGTVPFSSAKDELPIELQELFLENAYLSKLRGGNKLKVLNLQEDVLREYDDYVEETKEGIVSSLLPKKRRCLISSTWMDCKKSYLSSVRDDVYDNEYGYYGLITKGDEFKIFDIAKMKEVVTDKRKKTRGVACTSWDKKDLVQLCLRLNMAFPDLYEPYMKEINTFIKGSALLKMYSLEGMLEGKTKETIATAIAFVKNNKRVVCEHLKKWFADRQLLVRE